MDRSFEPGPIARRVILSALIGISLSSVLVFPAILAAFQYFVFHNDYWVRSENIGKNIYRIITNAPSITIVGIIISGPLVLLSVLTAILFRNIIKRRVLLWCCAAPISIWTFVSVIFAMISHDYYAFPNRLLATFSAIDNLIFLLGPMLASITFFYLSRRANARSLAGITSNKRSDGSVP
jgi:hypothetical protein